MATIIRPKNHDAWLEARKSGIGSSEVGTILGINPFCTPYQLWRIKKGIDAPVQENFAMRAGHYMEDAVSKFYADETGAEIIKSSAGDWLAQDKERPFLQASPDRTFWLPNMPKNVKNKGILECKTTQMAVDANNVPQHWYVQLQYQLGITGMRQGALGWLVAGREFGFRNFAFDSEIFTWITDEVERFWKDYVIGNLVPEAINASDVMLKCPRQIDGKYIIADEALADKCRSLKDINKELSTLSAKKKEIEDSIKMAMGDAEAVVTPAELGQQVMATWKAAKATTKFDEKRFAKEMPMIYSKYEYKQSGSRRFLLK